MILNVGVAFDVFMRGLRWKSFWSCQEENHESFRSPKGGWSIYASHWSLCHESFRSPEGPTNRGYKNYLQKLNKISLADQTKVGPFPKVVVSEQDRGKLKTPKDDPLVVEMMIVNLRVRRILTDTGSSMDIISACLFRLRFYEKNLVHVHHPIDHWFWRRSYSSYGKGYFIGQSRRKGYLTNFVRHVSSR